MRKIGIVMGVALAIWATACQVPFQYAARRFYREVHGIKYDAFEAKPLLRDLRTYDRLEVEPLDNQMEDRIPAELVSQLNQQIFKQVSRVKQFKVVHGAPPEGDRPELAVTQNDGRAPGAAPGEGVPSSFSPTSSVPARAEPPGPEQMAETALASHTLILRGAIVDYHPGFRAMRVLQIGVGREAVLTLHLWFVDGATGQELAQYVVDSEVYRMPADSHAAVNKMAKGVGQLVAKVVERRSRQSPKLKPEKKSQNSVRKSALLYRPLLKLKGLGKRMGLLLWLKKH